jgi:hypothetical protein
MKTMRLNWHYTIIANFNVGNKIYVSKSLCNSTGGELGSLWRGSGCSHPGNVDKKLY